MGLGYGLSEQIQFGPDGAPLNDTLLDYKLFTSNDMPQLDVLMVETHNEMGTVRMQGRGGSAHEPGRGRDRQRRLQRHGAYESENSPSRQRRFSPR